MKLLSIDSSGLVASVALVEDEILRAEYTVDYKKTHSQTLLPMLNEIKTMTGLELDTIDAIAIAEGPGSFTGLRIGAATAKGLGLALDKPIVPVPTVDALAFNLWGAGGAVCPLMNARRNQTYTGIYRFEAGKMQILTPQCVIALAEILQQVNALGEPVTFLGDGIPEFRETIQEVCTVPYCFAPAHKSRQHAGSVGVLGMQKFQNGEFVSADAFAPIYLRLSQAERERMEKEGKDPSAAEANV